MKGGGFVYSERMADLSNAAIYKNYFVMILECDNTAINSLENLTSLFRAFFFLKLCTVCFVCLS